MEFIRPQETHLMKRTSQYSSTLPHLSSSEWDLHSIPLAMITEQLISGYHGEW